MSDHSSRPVPSRPLNNTERSTLERLERDLDRAAARAQRVAIRRLERDLERDDPAFATVLRAGADSPVVASAASAAVRAWIWVLSLLLAVALGVGATAVVATTFGLPGLAVGAAVLLALFVGLVVGVRVG